MLISTCDTREEEFEVGKKNKQIALWKPSWASKAGVVPGFAGLTRYRRRCLRAHERAERGW